MREKTCCFIGHREIEDSKGLRIKLGEIIENLILKENVIKFIFGSKSRFDNICYEETTKLKEKYSHIIRIYIRAEYPEIDDNYERYLLAKYEQTYFAKNAFGKSAYITRNREMIDESDFCIIYFKENCLPKNRTSGTKSAFDYADKIQKKIILLPN